MRDRVGLGFEFGSGTGKGTALMGRAHLAVRMREGRGERRGGGGGWRRRPWQAAPAELEAYHAAAVGGCARPQREGSRAKKTTSVGCPAGGQRRVLQAEGGAGDVVGKGRPAAGQAERQAASRGR